MGAICCQRHVVQLAFKRDIRVDTKLVLIIALDLVSDLISRAASTDQIGFKICEILFEHKKAVSSAVSSFDAHLRSVSHQVLVDEEALARGCKVHVVLRDGYSRINLDTNGPVSITTSLAKVAFHEVFLTANKIDPK
jgi:hypothetical protein